MTPNKIANGTYRRVTTLSIWSAGTIILVALFLYAWQFMIDPRVVSGSTFEQIFGEISRELVGEHCRSEYRISNKPEAVQYAKDVWALKAQTWIFVAGGKHAYQTVFSSDSFRDSRSAQEIERNRSWVVVQRNEGVGIWEIDFNFSDSTGLTASMTARFSSCGRVENAEDLFFKKGEPR